MHNESFLRYLFTLSILLIFIQSSSQLTFKTPSILGSANYVTGFQGFADDQHALGKTPSGWVGTDDAGHTWTRVFVNDSDIIGTVSDAVLNKDNNIMHNMGDVTKVSDKMANYTSFNSTHLSVFSLDPSAPLGMKVEVMNVSLTFSGLPDPVSCGNSKKKFGCPFRLGGRGYVTMPDGIIIMSVIVWWGGHHANPDPRLAPMSTSVVAFRSTNGGQSWSYAGKIADAADAPLSQEGPNENDLTLLADGKTIMCVVRLDAGDGPLTRPYLPYYQSFSTDAGNTWSNITSLPQGVGSARPRLVQMDNGCIVLAGGRTGSKNRDILVWANYKGDGKMWEAYSISYWHNRLETNSSLHFTSSINTSGVRQSTSYTSLVSTGPNSCFLTYGRHLNDDVAFSMPISCNNDMLN